MMTRQNVKDAILEMLRTHLDPRLERETFRRSARSLIYRRPIPEGKQEIEIAWRRARYSDDSAVAHIGPHLRIVLPALRTATVEMVGPDVPHSVLEWAVSPNVGLVGPERSFVEWVPRDAQELRACGGAIGDYLERWVIPFLDEYRSAADLVRSFESGDQRMMWDETWYVTVAAAYILSGRPDRAWEVVQARFGEKAGLRRAYSHTLEYVGALVKSTVRNQD